jgi:hypothetical protein
MDETLLAFLRADDLDAIADARGRIRFISKIDAAALATVANEWSDEQAVANLLMYPEVIPQQARLATLRRGLGGDITDYATLAATVGLQRLAPGDASDDDRREIGARLLHLIESGNATLSRRASLTIGDFVAYVVQDSLLRLLDHSDETVRHNILAALVTAMGSEGVTQAVQRAIDAGRLDPELREHVVQALAPSGGTSVAEVPLLEYIPNLRDWKHRQG